MLTLTDSAAQYLKKALVGVNQPDNACFRLRIGQNGPDLALDQTRPGDQTLQCDGETVLAMEPAIGEQIGDRKLDFDEERSQLVLAQA